MCTDRRVLCCVVLCCVVLCCVVLCCVVLCCVVLCCVVLCCECECECVFVEPQTKTVAQWLCQHRLIQSVHQHQDLMFFLCSCQRKHSEYDA